VRSDAFRHNLSIVNSGERNFWHGKTAEKSPKWVGGTYAYWHEKAAELFMKDSCKGCGIEIEAYNKAFGNSHFDMHNVLNPKNYKMLIPEAWMTLCRSCHSRLEDVFGQTVNKKSAIQP
jgi:hypothetical protein